MRDHDKIKKPDRYQYSDSRSSHSCQDSHSKKTERGGRTEYHRKDDNGKQKDESGHDVEVIVKKEEKGLDSKTHFIKKKVAALTKKHAVQTTYTSAERDF